MAVAGSAMLAALTGCTGASLMKDGEYLYTGPKIIIKSDTLSKDEKAELKNGIENNLAPKPNSSILGMRPRLYFYKWAGDVKKEKGIRHWVKTKLGEKPVLLRDVDKKFNRDIAVNFAENIGYFNAKAKYETVTKGKLAKVEYTVTPKNRYLIDRVSFISDTTKIFQEILKTEQGSLLKPGNPYRLETVKRERLRIDNHMKENGYYYFSPDNLIVQADSTVGKSKVALNVALKDNTPALSKKQFTIDKVIIYPDYTIQNVDAGKIKIPTLTDSLEMYDDMYIIDPEKKFKPKIFNRVMYFKSGDVYNRTDHNLTLKRLINLGVFKFVKNQFVISDSLQNKFDAYYLLTPQEFQSLRLETLGKTNSANFNGGEVNLNWIHKNIFKGAEQLKVTAFGGFDVQVGGDRKASNIIRYGANATLNFPRIIAPFTFTTSSEFLPRTQVMLGYEFQNRTTQYSLHNFNASFGYIWKEDARKEHDLKVLSVSLVKPQRITEEYRQLAEYNPHLQNAVRKQFIFGPMYTYTFTNTMLPVKHQFYFRGLADLSANLTGLLMGANAKEGNVKKLFGVAYDQYAKIDTDFRYYYIFGTKNSIAARLLAGVAYPYGNSLTVPFSRQFFVGGSNSIRAFRARTLGPGSFDPRSLKGTFYADMSGDIRLETNLEYRQNIYKFLNAAAFVDAGNIWLVNEDPARPGGKFSKDWLSQVAVGGGIGLRFDFNFFVLRTDLAIPFRVPYYPEGERWRFSNMNFGNKDWRRENLILNIAIGYPF